MMKPAWGKYDEESGVSHCLEHHCADVAACFEGLLKSPVLRSRFESAAGDGQFCEVTQARLTVIAFLHDFAKLNSGFQFKVRRDGAPPLKPSERAGHITEAFFFCRQPDLLEKIGLIELMEEWGPGVNQLLLAALSHHGRPPTLPESENGPPHIWQPVHSYDPGTAAELLRQRVRAWFPEAFQPGPHLPDTPELVHLFAGVVALADHIGSHREAFPFKSESDTNYIETARERAETILQERGFHRKDHLNLTKFENLPEIFEYQTLHPMQQAVADASLDHPLLILESETGSGKTEAAVIRFIQLWRADLVDGLYFAVPTRAAAKQLHERVNSALERLSAGSAKIETVLAIPGYLKVGTAKGKKNGKYQVRWDDNPNQAKKESRWAGESALHFLSAMTAVGTIDQALLASLKVKWAHLRGASLARSLLVVDEVHASDEYMITLLRSLLRDHLAVGGHAMLMSATLGTAARIRLSSCNSSGRIELPSPQTAKKTPYPAITLANGDPDKPPSVDRIEGSAPPKHIKMEVNQSLGDASRIAELAHEQARKGAKILVIRNTVSSAQAVFKELLRLGDDELLFQVNGFPALHHSRFAVEDRRRLDEAVETALGKEREGRKGLVVVGTQTLEQSLDIDADLLITDLCPIDVLLQRTGRLHRHSRDRARPFSKPRCIVMAPKNGLEDGLNGGLLKHGLGISRKGSGIYLNLLTIRQTQQLIEDHPVWDIPDMNRRLVEQATHPDLLREQAQALGDAWQEHEKKVSGIEIAMGRTADNCLLNRTEERFDDEKFAFLDRNMNIRTRLGEDGPRIVLKEKYLGPFGKPVRTFNLPAHLFHSGKDKDEDGMTADKIWDISENVTVKQGHGNLLLCAGGHTFLYDQTGIQKTDETPQNI